MRFGRGVYIKVRLGIIFTIAVICSGARASAEEPPLRIGLQEPWHHLNPLNPPTLTSYRIQDLLYDRLVYWDPHKQAFVGGLARDLKFDSQNRFLDLSLQSRQNCIGRRLQSSDVLWSFEVLTSEDSPVYRRLLRAIKRLEVRSGDALRIHFEKGRYEEIQMALTSFRVFSKPERVPIERLEGFGPYCLLSSTERNIRVRRNPNNITPYSFRNLEFKLIPDRKVQYLSLNKKEIDVTDFSFEKKLESADTTRDSQLVNGPPHELRIQINLSDPQLKQKSNRQALVRSIDKNWIATSLFSTNAIVISLPQHQGKSNQVVLAPSDLSKTARIDLREMFKYRVFFHEDTLEPFLTTWQTQARANGIILSVDKMTTFQANQARKDGRYQLYAYFTEESPEIASALWRSDGAFNTSGYKNAQVDSLLTQLSNTVQPKQRRDLHQNLASIIDNDLAELRVIKNIQTRARASLNLDTRSPQHSGLWFFSDWQWKR